MEYSERIVAEPADAVCYEFNPAYTDSRSFFFYETFDTDFASGSPANQSGSYAVIFTKYPFIITYNVRLFHCGHTHTRARVDMRSITYTRRLNFPNDLVDDSSDSANNSRETVPIYIVHRYIYIPYI